MDRIATNSAYNSVLTNLMAAEIAQSTAGNQISSTEKATDLKGYGTGAETLTAMQATNSQVTGYLNNSQVVAAKLSIQDTGLNQVASSATSAISDITNAIATGNGATLMQQLQTSFDDAVQGLNTQFNGEYVFAGGQVNTQPVSATSLSNLVPGPISSLFHNDNRQISTQIDQNTSLSTGFLANQVGTPLFTALQTIQQYVQTNGPFGATLTQAQQDFLTQQLSPLTTVQTNLNNVVAQNGLAQAEVTNTQGALSQQQTMLQGLIGTATQADLAQADANLQQAQLSIQAAGQVFQALNASSLLNTLSSSMPLA
ncbi:MAG TPA: flagellin [Caulobacteraceae bacterium]|jgi:flagellar hook-associated protein 3 FlgL|nr:flagellin [Caulobacteraceae bacterium]